MLIYILLLAGTVILGVLLCRSKTGNLIYCILGGIALFVIAALRRSVGHDYNNYGWMYIGYMSTPLETIAQNRTEKGYSVLCKLLADYIPEYQSIFIVMAAFFAVCTAVCVYRYCKRPWLGFTFFLVFGVYFNTLNFLRQMAAGFIMLYAFKFIRKNQFFRYLILVLLATCFHRSALIMIPFYFILRIKMTPVTLGAYSVLVTLFMVFSWDIMAFASKFLYAYQGYTLETNKHLTSGVNPTFMVFVALFFILAFVFRKRLTERDPFNNVLINCLFFLLMFEVIGVKHSIISRLGVYFIIPAALLLMPKLFEEVLAWCRQKFRKDKKKITAASAIAVSAIAAVSIVMYSMMLSINYNGILPYRTMFEDFSTEAAE
ncbi:MAG: EpsG family protein [Ruminiclostridium sp.]|nr:EpsG family protein [Ruminiclostridium sp.]